jgi:hypothetical protein
MTTITFTPIGVGPSKFDLETFRAKLCKMPDAELVKSGKQLAFLCSPGQNFGKPPHKEWAMQLEESRAEWRRRHPKQSEASRATTRLTPPVFSQLSSHSPDPDYGPRPLLIAIPLYGAEVFIAPHMPRAAFRTISDDDWLSLHRGNRQRALEISFHV